LEDASRAAFRFLSFSSAFFFPKFDIDLNSGTSLWFREGKPRAGKPLVEAGWAFFAPLPKNDEMDVCLLPDDIQELECESLIGDSVDFTKQEHNGELVS
jgi:hypothetical protein